MAMDQQVADGLEVQGLKTWGGQGIGSNNNGGGHHVVDHEWFMIKNR